MFKKSIIAVIAASSVTAVTVSAQAAGPSPATSGAACDAEDPMVVGAAFSLSGPAADIGAQAEEGALMAVEDINAEGGVLGRCLELILKDDGGDPTKASQVTRELVDQDEVSFIVGPFLSSAIGSSIEVTAPAEILHVVAGVLPAAGDAASFPYVFRTEVEASLQSETFVAYMTAAGLTAPALLAVNNALGTSNIDALGVSLEGTDIEVVATEFHETGSTDLTAQMRALMDAEPDVLILLNTAGPDLTAALTARESLAWDVPVLAFSAAANASVTGAVGDAGMDGVLAGQAYRLLAREAGATEPFGEAAAAFRERYKEHRGEETLELNLQQPAGIYDSFMMMATAINAVGDLDPDGVSAYLEENGYDGVKATYEFTEERHDGIGLDDLVFVIADSLEDGVLEIAPGQ